VIYLEADEELDVNDIEYTDLYLVIIKHVADDLARLGLRFDARLLRSFEEWFKEITDETEESVNKSFSLETIAEAKAEIPFISKLLAKLQAHLILNGSCHRIITRCWWRCAKRSGSSKMKMGRRCYLILLCWSMTAIVAGTISTL
jgi:hypothetical protein